MKITSDLIDGYFYNGVDILNRRIFMWGAISEESSKVVCQALYGMDADGSKKEICLFVNSEGGECDSMWAIYDTLNTIKCDVSTVAIGKCMSAAPLIVAAGTKGKRYTTENCDFMIHEQWASDIEGSLSKVKNEVDYWDFQKKRWAHVMESKTLKNAAFWNGLCSGGTDSYFCCNEAIDYGIVDRIWKEK